MVTARNDSLPVSRPLGHPIYNNLPLDASKREIRLLEILPGSGQEALDCTLICVGLNPELPYLALSYTWSLDKPLLSVRINGLDFPIRENLYAALLQIRRSSYSVRLWADAVCINQTSIPERNAQVPLMREIYHAASRVLIWLGEGNESTGLAIEALHKLVALRTDSEYVLDDFRVLLPERIQAWDILPEERNQILRSIKTGLNDIFTRPWWDRTWTVQELALARDCPLLICGTWSICFECFRTTTVELDRYLAKLNLADKMSDYWVLSGVQNALASRKPSSLDSIRNLTRAAIRLRNGGVNSFLALLLSYTQHSLCSDPRDKIYGLLGIAEPEALETIGIDYNMSILEVYTKATIYLIIRNGFQILSLQGLWPSREEWPSWVVDFRRPLPENHEPLVRGHDHPRAKYCPLPYEGPETLAHFRAEGILRINAITIDRIVETSPIWQANESSGSRAMHSITLVGDAFRVSVKASRPCIVCISQDEQDRCSHPSYKPENSTTFTQPLRDAICRTLVAEWDPTRRHSATTPISTSSSHLRTLHQIIYDLTDDREILALLGISPADKHHSLSRIEFQSQVKLTSERLFKVSNGRMAFRTERGWIGTGTYDTKAGDMVITVVGADVPFIIRPSGIDTDPRVRLVGDCYVDGIMFGECTRNQHFRADGDINGVLQLYPIDIC